MSLKLKLKRQGPGDFAASSIWLMMQAEQDWRGPGGRIGQHKAHQKGKWRPAQQRGLPHLVELQHWNVQV